MTMRRMVFMLVLCSLMALLAVEALTEARSSNQPAGVYASARRRRTTDSERRREAARRRALARQEAERKQRASANMRSQAGAQSKTEQRQKEAQKRATERKKQLLSEKHALAATEEQWQIIKPKLEKVRHLRDRARSTVNLFMASSSGSGAKTASGTSANAPIWQWNVSWKDKSPDELPEAKKIANELMALVDRRSATTQEFTRKMAALRESRTRQVELEKQLSEARQELRAVLMPRQEAALVLMRWL